MARLSRIVIPDVAHHVTQRGNRRLPVFFGDDDRRLYLDLVREGCLKAQVTCLAWCLMDNHVHLVLVPQTQAGLRDALGEAHRRYSRAINFRHGWRGYLFQGRFASYPMDDAHLMAAVRYVENNPVAAKLVAQAEDWPWSLLCHLKTGPFAARVFRCRHPWLGEEVWREGIEVHGRAEGVRHQAGRGRNAGC